MDIDGQQEPVEATGHSVALRKVEGAAAVEEGDTRRVWRSLLRGLAATAEAAVVEVGPMLGHL